jgi:hypothetical protein
VELKDDRKVKNYKIYYTKRNLYKAVSEIYLSKVDEIYVGQ